MKIEMRSYYTEHTTLIEIENKRHTKHFIQQNEPLKSQFLVKTDAACGLTEMIIHTYFHIRFKENHTI